MCGLASSSAPVDPASITLQPPAGTDELRKHLEEILSQQLERLIPLHLERLLPACLERISAVNGNGAGSAPHDILVQQPDEEEVLPLGDEEDVKMQEQFVASLVKIEASARHAATSASASSSKVQGAEVIDLCDSVPDTDLEDEDDDTQEMMKNRPRLSKKLAHFLMAKKASTISELDDAIEVEVAALSMSTEEIRSEILRRLQLIPEKLWHKGPRRRPNVLRPEERRRGSNQLILGLITSGSFQKLPTISNETWMFPNLTKLILVYLDRLAKDQGWTKLPKGTTIQVTYNLETQLHVDGNNGGTSFGTSVGDHAGGKVFLSDAQGDEIWRLEEDIRRVGKEGDKIRGRRETTKDRLVEFDGNQIHGTCPFTGTRYAIILFGLSPSAVEETAELNKAYLTEMGFHYFDFVPRASERDLARRAAHDAAAGEDLKYEPPGKVPPPMRPHKRQKLADV